MTDYALVAMQLTREALDHGLMTYTPRELRSLDNREAWHARATDRKEPRTPRSKRPRCGAQTRRGKPCSARAVPGSARCRVHGGLSTGPRTDDGREAIRVSNRRRAVLADLVELDPDMNEIRRRQWAAAILDLAAGGTRATAGEAAGVTEQTIGRWCKVDTFDDTLTRAGQRLRRRQQAAERSMNIESTCIDLGPMPDLDLAELLAADPLEGLDLSIPENLLEDLKLPELEPLDLDAILAELPSPPPVVSSAEREVHMLKASYLVALLVVGLAGCCCTKEVTLDTSSGPGALWYENGQKAAEGAFKAGQEHGPWTNWYESGQKREEGEYKDGQKHGPWTYWYEDGSLDRTETY